MIYFVNIDNKTFAIDVDETKNGFKLLVDKKPVNVEVTPVGDASHLSFIINNKSYDVIIKDENSVSVEGELYEVLIEDENQRKFREISKKVHHHEEKLAITAPMPGLIVKVEAKVGDKVKTGDGLIIMEAMKMQNELRAPKDGTVKEIRVKEGITVNGGDTLLALE
jgi:biotin carboxyl carrier protein